MNTLHTDTLPRAGYRPWKAYALEAGYEGLRLLRTPSFALPALGFPVLFYLLFGVLLAGGRGGADAARYMMVGYGVFGAIGPALFGFGAGLAIDRERGLLTLKRALPLPPGALLGARTASALAFALVIALMLLAAGTLLGGVRLSAAEAALLVAVQVLGTLPFCALGLLIGSLVRGQGAPGVVNLVYLPMSLLSGLWMPLAMLPEVVQQLAVVWPAYHLGQLALHVVGMDAGDSVALHLAVLAGTTALCFGLAARRLRDRG